MKKNKFSFKEEYKKSWNYLKGSKKLIWTVLIIFFISFLIGFFISLPESLSQRVLDFIQNILSRTEGMNNFQLVKFIFLNNFQSSFFSMIFGIFFGIFPVFAVISNGFLLGFVSNLSMQKEGILSLWRIFPHGIFELPAMFISFALGIRIGFSFLDKKKFGDFKENIYSSLRIFILIVMPLLILAAIIEGTLIFLRI